jgi:hypothetical protein
LSLCTNVTSKRSTAWSKTKLVEHAASPLDVLIGALMEAMVEAHVPTVAQLMPSARRMIEEAPAFLLYLLPVRTTMLTVCLKSYAL